MRFYKIGSIKTQFLHRLQIIGRYLEKIKGEMKVFRNFIFLSFYPSKMGKSESKPAYQKGTPIPKDPEGILRIFFWGFLIPALSVLERLFFQGLIVIRYYLALRGAENGVTVMVTPFFCVQG